MSNEGGAGACAPPPSYYEAIGQTYSYVDFAPACLKAGGFLKSPLFEKFEYVAMNIWSIQFFFPKFDYIFAFNSFVHILTVLLV